MKLTIPINVTIRYIVAPNEKPTAGMISTIDDIIEERAAVAEVYRALNALAYQTNPSTHS